MTYVLNLADIQGYILRGYNMPRVRHFLLRIGDAQQGRKFLGSLVEPGPTPQITSATSWQGALDRGYKKPPYCLNIGVTFQGLQALALPRPTLASFAMSRAFVEGPLRRAAQVGDTDANAPEYWDAPFRTPHTHLLLSLYTYGKSKAEWEGELEKHTQALRQLFATYGIREVAAPYEGEVLRGESDDYEHVHFGFRDGISQPLIDGAPEPGNKAVSAANRLPPGAFLFGYPSQWADFSYPLPEPAVLGVNGSFAAFRVLEQNVKSFQDYLVRAAEQHGMLQPLGNVVAETPKGECSTSLDHQTLRNDLRVKFATDRRSTLSSQASVVVLTKGQEWRVFDQGRTYIIKKDGHQLRLYTPEPVAAKICGRWFNGYPLAVPAFRDFNAQEMSAPPDPKDQLNNFDYLQDEQGHGCPFGAHIRRTNPRTDRIAGNTSAVEERGSAASKRRIIRRGMPYGPEYTGREDEHKRGLLGLFIGVSLEDQFEFIMKQWVHAGGFHGPLPSDAKDPLIGNHTSPGELALPAASRQERLQSLPRFVTTRGGLYCFLPSLAALRYMAGLST